MNKMYNICLLLYFRSFIAEMKFYVNKIRQSKSMIFWYFFFFNQFRGNMKLANLLLILIKSVLFVPDIHAREHGSNKQVASKSCALSLVRQLFHMGVIEAYTGQTKKKDQDKVSIEMSRSLLKK